MKNLFLVVLAVRLLIGCSKNDDNNDVSDNSSKVIMPLGVVAIPGTILILLLHRQGRLNL